MSTPDLRRTLLRRLTGKDKASEYEQAIADLFGVERRIVRRHVQNKFPGDWFDGLTELGVARDVFVSRDHFRWKSTTFAAPAEGAAA